MLISAQPSNEESGQVTKPLLDFAGARQVLVELGLLEIQEAANLHKTRIKHENELIFF